MSVDREWWMGWVRRVPAVWLGLTVAAMAEGFRNPPDGASVQGHMGGRLAFANDASTAAHNPANLIELSETEVLGSVTWIYAKKEFALPGGGMATASRDRWAMLPAVYAAVPLGDDARYVLGLTLNTPFGQSTRWDRDSIPGRFSAYDASLKVLHFGPSLAAGIGSALSVGLGLNVYWSELEMSQFLPVEGGMAPGPVMELEGDGTALGFHAGATWRMTERHRLALVYRSAFDVEYDGRVTVNGPLPLSVDQTTELRFPSVLAVGYGWQISDTLRLGADVEWVENSRFQELNLSLDTGEGPVMSGALPASVRQNWDDTMTVSVGVQWRFRPAWTLRAGYSFVESPIPDETLLPYMAEGDQNMISSGVGYRANAHRFELAYAYSLFADREVRGNQVPVYDGDYDFESHLLSVSYAYAF